MPRSEAQIVRLAEEKTVLEHFFPGCVKWIDPTGDTKVDVTLNTNNDNKYTVRIYIEDFPNAAPDMVVVSSPKPTPVWEGSYDNHTLLSRDGYLRICHYHPNQWTDFSSLYEVVMKGRVWLEAYEGHIRTGKPMNYFLKEMIQPDQTRSEANEGTLSDVNENHRSEDVIQRPQPHKNQGCLLF